MFKLTRPCSNCPFRVGQGELYLLGPERLRGFMTSPAFQCHKTIDYGAETRAQRSGEHPQQCAGIMSLLHRIGRPNAIMQVGQRFGHFDPARLDHSECYPNVRALLRAHRPRRSWRRPQ